MNGLAPKVCSVRRHLPWVAMLAVTAACVTAGSAHAASILTQFQGAGLANSGYVPSDMGGSVGDGYVVQMVNGVSSIYSTTGTLDLGNRSAHSGLACQAEPEFRIRG